MRYSANIYAQDETNKSGRAKVGSVDIEAADLPSAVAELGAQLSDVPEEDAALLVRVQLEPAKGASGLTLRMPSAKKGKGK